MIGSSPTVGGAQKKRRPKENVWKAAPTLKNSEIMLTNVLLKSCWVALALLVVCIPILFAACQKSNDDYYAEARVRLVLPDSLRLEKLQGTVRLTNLNNKQSFTTSTFQAGEASLEVFRGVYAVDVEGSVRYAAPDGTNQTANFRASTPYIKVLDHPSLVSLDIILM